jgi:hypothetical protein
VFSIVPNGVFSIIPNEENLKQNEALIFTLIEMVCFAWKREEQFLIFNEKPK